MSTHKERLDYQKKRRIKKFTHFIGIVAILVMVPFLLSLHNKFTPKKLEPSKIERLNNFDEYERTRLYSECFLRFEYRTPYRKYREGWLINRQDNSIVLESTILNKGLFTIGRATVTIFFVDSNFDIVTEFQQDIIGGSTEVRHLLPQESKPVKVRITNPPCNNCQPVPIVTHISFLGQV